MSRAGRRQAPPDAPRGSTHATTPTPPVEIGQYSLLGVLAVWAAAAVPMGVLAWLVAPALAHRFSGTGGVPLLKSLLVCLTAGLVWQFVLVAVLVAKEQRNLRWATLREALWLRSPRSPRTGRTGGRTWLVLVPLVLLFATEDLFPGPAAPADRDLGALLESDAGREFFSGNWTWFAVLVVLWIFNTVLGEELLFRGLLLPRMNATFGRADWVANGVLFAAYHLHIPWTIPVTLLDTFLLAYPTKRYRSAWIGIAVHSSQSVFFGALVLALVLR